MPPLLTRPPAFLAAAVGGGRVGFLGLGRSVVSDAAAPARVISAASLRWASSSSSSSSPSKPAKPTKATKPSSSASSASTSAVPTAGASPLFQAALSEAAAASATAPPSSSSSPQQQQQQHLLQRPPRGLAGVLATSRRSAFASALAGGREAGVALAFRSAAFRMSPWKANLVARMVRGLTLAEAQAQCRFSRKRAATRVGALLRRAAAAIAQRGLQRPAPAEPSTTTEAAAAAAAGVDWRTGWRVEQCFVGKGRYLRRVKLHARGKVGLMHHPSSHVRVVLRREDGVGAAAGEPADAQRRRLELARLAHMLRRHRLYVPLPQHKPLHFLHPVWSRKPHRYVDSPKWTDPSAVLAKRD
ncbi:54S ribosomal protein L22, mitochondrial [Cladochytrium tenue]|nr:54S ribosomal protein L22, mitochondrial [Cladochytrium tenue]